MILFANVFDDLDFPDAAIPAVVRLSSLFALVICIIFAMLFVLIVINN